MTLTDREGTSCSAASLRHDLHLFAGANAVGGAKPVQDAEPLFLAVGRHAAGEALDRVAFADRTMRMRSGLVDAASAGLMRRKVLTASRNERSAAGAICLVAKMKR